MDVCTTQTYKVFCQFLGRALVFLLLVSSCATPPKPLPAPWINPVIWEQATTVTGTGIPHAQVYVWHEGLPIANGTISSEGTYELTVEALHKEQILTATQTLNGQKMSMRSAAVPVQNVTLTGIEIHPALSTIIEQGQSFPYTVKGMLSNGQTQKPLPEVTWVTKQPAVATIDTKGIVTGLEAGTTTIQATQEGIQSAQALLTVKPRPPVVNASLNAGDTTVTGMASPSAQIKIMVNEIPLTRPITADAEGRWQANNLPPLKEHDRVTSFQLVKHIQSDVSLPIVATPAVLTEITLNPSPATETTLELGQSQRFTATGIFSNGRTETPMAKVTWLAQHPRVAMIDAEGTVTGLAVGTTAVQATREGIQSAQALLTVKPRPPVVNASLNAGDTTVTGMASPSALIKIMVNEIPLDQQVMANVEGQWQADKLPPLKEHDRVTSSQLLRHVQSAASTPVVVAPAALTHITLAPGSDAKVILEQGQSQRLTASGLFSNGRTETPMPKVTWSTTPPTVAAIDADGTVTGLKAGTTTVQATWEGIQSDPVQLTVKPHPPVVASPLKAGDTIITGSASSLANIQLLKNGIPLDTQILANKQGQWQASNLSPLHESDQITSIQTVNSAQSEPATPINVLPNHPPRLDPIGDQTIAVGETLRVALHATDPEGDTLAFEVIERPLPENSLLDEKTGLFTFTPSSDQVGASVITFLVSDGNTSQQETITVKVMLPKSLVVLLESPDGTVGSIQVANAAGSQQLDKAGQAVSLGSADQAPPEPFMLKEEDILEVFKDALEAKPAEPISYTLHFESDTNLSQESQRLLPEIFSAIAERASPDISIIGHSDRSGSDEYNYQLSLRRASSVFDAFVATGINPKLMEVTSHGENNPIVKTPDGISEPRNRRVEIIIR
ncbi:MAG: hypothetical protein NPIRA05_08270 [Nitrospirales bacterium]|nr:MAG: hypothetical protein NPIRA05_08270 [Nitrospirales bacterium]